MAKPRIFISSTFYDLRQIRSELDKFIMNLGYEPIRNEEGDIPYGKEEELQKYCYREIENVDILVSIIGNRYGSTAIVEDKEKEYSVTQQEIKTAFDRNKQVYIFIDKNVLTEYETYLLNKKNKDITYKYVDNPNIYRFIEEVKSWSHNNNIKDFETADDITRYLKEQFAGLFKQYMDDRNRVEEILDIKDIKETAKTLHELVDYLREDTKGKDKEISRIIRIDHPLVGRLKKLLEVPYNFYIEGYKDLKALLYARGYRPTDEEGIWTGGLNKENNKLTISMELFDNDVLKYIRHDEWKDEYVTLEEIVSKAEDNLPDNLPF